MQNLLKTGAIGKTKNDLILSVLMFLYCALLPFEEAFAYSFGSILRIFGVLIIAYIFFSFISEPVKRYNLFLLAPFIIWVIYSAVSVIWSDDFSWWSYFFKIYISQIALVVFVVLYCEHINFEYLKNGLIVGAVIASAMLILMPASSQLTEEGRRTIIIFDKVFDPNIVASIISLGLFMIIGKIFSQKSRKKLYIFLMIILAIGMLFTGSRGALISLVAGFGVQLFLQMKKKNTRKKALFMVFLCVVIVIVALAVLPSELILSRFSKETLFGFNELASGSHNRYTIWKNALTLIWKAPIIGYGCGNFFSAIATVYRECASHNLYILLFVEGGVIGFLIFVYGLAKLLFGAYKRQLYSVLGMLFSVLVMAITLDSITYKYFWVAIIFSAISIIKSDENLTVKQDE